MASKETNQGFPTTSRNPLWPKGYFMLDKLARIQKEDMPYGSAELLSPVELFFVGENPTLAKEIRKTLRNGGKQVNIGLLKTLFLTPTVFKKYQRELQRSPEAKTEILNNVDASLGMRRNNLSLTGVLVVFDQEIIMPLMMSEDIRPSIEIAPITEDNSTIPEWKVSLAREDEEQIPVDHPFYDHLVVNRRYVNFFTLKKSGDKTHKTLRFQVNQATTEQT